MNNRGTKRLAGGPTEGGEPDKSQGTGAEQDGRSAGCNGVEHQTGRSAGILARQALANMGEAFSVVMGGNGMDLSAAGSADLDRLSAD